MSPRVIPPVTSTIYLSSAQVRLKFGGRGPLWIARQIKENGFPKPYKFGGRLLYWKASEIEAWENERAERAA